MKQFKPVLLKTYGKQRRKVSAWISPDHRKQAFDSSESSLDSSKAKQSSQERIGVRRHPAAKGKARQCVPEISPGGEEIIIISSSPDPAPPPPRKTRRTMSQTNMQLKKEIFPGRKTRKRKAVPCPTETSSHKENKENLSTSPTQLNRKSKTGRRTRLVSVPGGQTLEGQLISFSNDQEESAPKQHKNSAEMSTGLTGRPLSVGRFVTRRRCPPPRPKPPEGRVSLLNSSNDFTPGASHVSRICRPSRKRRKPSSFGSSSEEISPKAAGRSTFVFNPLREILLNELTDHSLKHGPTKPIFCSTPSASFFNKSTSCKSFPINNLSAESSSVSVSSIRDLSSSQENLVFPSLSGLLRSPPQQPAVKQPEEPDRSDRLEPSAGPSVARLSADSAGASHFMSATGGLEWLTEILKEKCLTQRCTVQMKRLDCNALSELCMETTYSSCLEYSSSVHHQSAHQHPQHRTQTAEPSLNLQLSLTCDSFQEESSLEEAASATDARSNIASPIVDQKHSAKPSSTQVSMEARQSVRDSRKTLRHDGDTFEDTVDMPSPSVPSTLLTPETATETESVRRKCSVQLQRLTPEQLSGSGDADSFEKGHARNSKEMRCSGEITESRTENAAVLASLLKEKCLANKATVSLKRATRSQLKEILRFKDAILKSPAASPSARDERTRNDSHNSMEDSPSLKAEASRQDSAGLDHVGTEREGEPDSCDVTHNRKKTSLAPRERKASTTTNKPGTTRKACVSGMSVTRWKSKGSTTKDAFGCKAARTRSDRSADCTMNDLIPRQHQYPQDMQKFLGATMNFSTPLKASRLNLSSLMADLTPSTPSWSRLKAALSVHRKVLLTPKCLAIDSPDGTDLDVSQDLFAMPLRTPLSKHLQSQLRSVHSLVPCEDDLSDAEKVYAECGQLQPLSWEECVLPQRMKKCVKIGEGTFGEVFTIPSPSGDTVALKVIPVEGAEKVNGEDQKTFGEILHEIIISKELSSLKEQQNNQTHGFIGLKDLHCVKGCYPPDFLKAWDTFDKRKCSENDRPDFFEEDQLFLILEFEFGGVDLENSSGTLASLVVAKSILHQVTAALAVAEQALHFEHRDLHWGNVLVKTTKQKTGSFLLNGTAQSIETKGVLVRIIDYSLSRLEIDNLTVSCDISNDEELFMGQGDYQFDIYRRMREENGNNWSSYRPHTNVLWLHYLCSKLLSMKYRSSRGRDAKDVRKELTCFYDNVLQYGSATEVLRSCPTFH